MIHSISGVVKGVEGYQVVIGLGVVDIEIQAPHSALLMRGELVTLAAYFHWNAEHGPSLFGFATELDKKVFLLIIDCPGVGPKLGVGILAHLGVKDFLDAVQTNNAKALSSVSGIGAKKAEQIIVQLRDKVAKLIQSGIDLGGSTGLEHWHTVSQALASLNYNRSEIAAAMKQVSEMQGGQQATFDQLMRQALSVLARRSL